MNTPDPEQKPAPEIRGGDRPSDYIGFPPGTFENSEIEVTPEEAEQLRAKLKDALKNREPLVYDREIEHPDHYEDADDE